MSELRGACAAARPVVARMVGAIDKCLAIRLRAGQHVVPIRIDSHAVDHFALLIQRRLLEQITTKTREFDCVTVQIGEILSYRCSFGVVPGTLSDAVAGIHGWLIAASLRAEVGVPSAIAGAHR